MNLVRRTVDLFLSTLGLILLSPVFLVCAMAIRLNSPGPIFYLQNRVGYLGRNFLIFKFRSMVLNSEEDDLQVTGEADARITLVGRWLRRYKLDELPQLYNVFRGDMSFVGPRPRVDKYARHYPPELRDVLFSVRPGVTDPATLKAIRQERILGRIPKADREKYYLERILPGEVGMNVDYIRKRTLGSDFKILIRTVLELLVGRPGPNCENPEKDSGPVLRRP
ncbi:MAG: sugar transferase [Acidobacteriota bacterium]